MHSKTYLIIGATGGIGEAVCRRIRADGDKTVLVGRSYEKLAKLSEALQSPAFSINIADAIQVRKGISEIFDQFEEINGVIHAAGVFSSYNFADSSAEEKKRVFETNVKGLYLVSEHIFEKWKGKTYDRTMVFVSSIAGLGEVPGKREIYAYSKKMVIELFKRYQRRFGSSIAISCICPGPTKTPMWEKVLQNCAEYEHISIAEVIARYKQEGYTEVDARVTASHILEILGTSGYLYVPLKNMKKKVVVGQDFKELENFLESL